MAPDLNAVSAGERWDYSAPGSAGYDIPDTTLNDPANRRVRVLTIGGGVSGILIAYQIQKYCQNVELKVFEKNHEIGGTWLENRYPGAACDIPSHAYTFNFALNPEWPAFFSYSPDIWKYLDKVCEVFGLRKYMTFNTEVVGCWWNDDKGEWKVKLCESERLPSGERKEIRTYEETCDVLLHATGILNNWKWPDVKGLHDFKGRVVHTARWPEDYGKEQWKNDRVAVVGSGASSIQTVPTMQPHAKHLDIFVRTAVWFIELAGHSGENVEYSAERKQEFRKDPEKLVEHGKSIEDQVNGLWGIFYSDTPAQNQAKEIYAARMGQYIKDERLLKGFTPKFGIGCRRVTPGDPYMMAIQKPNVDVHFTPVESVTSKGVVGADGVEREVDTIVCATGFDVSYKPRFPLVGKSGQDLSEKWKIIPESYLGLAIPDFPNFLTFIGPTWPVENGSVMGPLLTVSEYAIQIIKKIQKENIKSLAPRQDVTDSFNDHCQEWIKHTVWKEDCRAWYRNNETGRVNAVWPGASLHYQHVIRTPRYEDFEIEYRNKRNMWAFLGMGWTDETRITFAIAGENGVLQAQGATPEQLAEKAKKDKLRLKDVSPYINQRYLDPRWLAANGMGKEEAKELVIKQTAERAANRLREELDRAERGEGGDAANTSGFDATLL